MGKKITDLSGQSIGFLTVLHLSDKKINLGFGTSYYWWCRCICGKVFEVSSACLLSHNQKSCGCKNNKFSTHGESSRNVTKEYVAWCCMIKRCYEENWDHFSDYGGRGITMCDEWRNSYETFLRDMGRAPSKLHTLDRLEVDGNYCKSNCRWATKMEQSRNKRNNVVITYEGETKILKDWAQHFGIDYKQLHTDLKYRGHSFIDVLKRKNKIPS